MREVRPAAPGLMTELDGARRLAGLSIAELAASAGITRFTLYRVLSSGQANLHTLRALADALDYDVKLVRREPFDEINVERACNGQVVALTSLERIAVIARLTERGCTARVIAERTGIAKRTVQRYRANAREAA